MSESPDLLSSSLSPVSRRGSDPEATAENQWRRPKDPWETNLVPQEPNPSHFANEQDYREAMTNWASLTIKKMIFLPPHPAQLTSLVDFLHIASDVRIFHLETTIDYYH